MTTETQTTEVKKKPVVKIREISYDGVLRAGDVQILTGLSRVTIWREERAGRFPARVQLTRSRIGWYGSEVQDWIKGRLRVDLAPEIKNREVMTE